MRVCVIGAGPCGLTAVKNLLQAGCRDVVCYEESGRIGGNWAFTEDPGRASVHECTHTISSRRLSSFDDFPMPGGYPNFPSHRQLLAYFTEYAVAFRLQPYIRLNSHVSRCELGGDGRWTVRVNTNGTTRAETFDSLLVCSGHHRDAYVPRFPGTFAGTIVHSSAYKRPDPFHGQRVLVVGAGNSGADIAVDVARVAAYTALSVREGTYIVPRLVSGRPVDTVYAFWRGKLPRPILRSALRLWLRLAIGTWADHGLPTPTHAPLDKPPTVNSGVLAALRHGRLVARPGIARYDGHTVLFTDGTRGEFDAIILGTGFRSSFSFLPERMIHWDQNTPPPLYLRMMHLEVPSLYFIGLFQPTSCIWRLADYQARIAALQITGQLKRPEDLDGRIRHEVARAGGRFAGSPRHPLLVDDWVIRRDLMRELAARPGTPRRRGQRSARD